MKKKKKKSTFQILSLLFIINKTECEVCVSVRVFVRMFVCACVSGCESESMSVCA